MAEKKLTDGEKLLLAGFGLIAELREKLDEMKKDIEKSKAKAKSKTKGGECACGCGEKTAAGRKFVKGHNLNVK